MALTTEELELWRNSFRVPPPRRLALKPLAQCWRAWVLYLVTPFVLLVGLFVFPRAAAPWLALQVGQGTMAQVVSVKYDGRIPRACCLTYHTDDGSVVNTGMKLPADFRAPSQSQVPVHYLPAYPSYPALDDYPNLALSAFVGILFASLVSLVLVALSWVQWRRGRDFTRYGDGVIGRVTRVWPYFGWGRSRAMKVELEYNVGVGTYTWIWKAPKGVFNQGDLVPLVLDPGRPHRPMVDYLNIYRVAANT